MTIPDARPDKRPYEPPIIEAVMSPEGLRREILYAGFNPSDVIVIPDV